MILAVDAGGTYLRGELYSGDVLQKEFKGETAHTGLSEWIELILENQKNIKTVCVSFAGQVKDGVILSSPNIAEDRRDIKKYFESKFSVEFFIQNDLNCAVLAEAEYFKSDNICAVYVGTGLGLGVVSSSTLITGADGIATELGHIPYRESPFVCGCGKKNCMELFTSGTALKHWKHYYDLDENLTLQELKKMDHIIYTEFEKALLVAASTIVTLFNPEILVFGGGIIQSNSYLVEMIKNNIGRFAMPLSLKNLKIMQTELKNAPIKGAVLQQMI